MWVKLLDATRDQGRQAVVHLKTHFLEGEPASRQSAVNFASDLFLVDGAGSIMLHNPPGDSFQPQFDTSHSGLSIVSVRSIRYVSSGLSHLASRLEHRRLAISSCR